MSGVTLGDLVLELALFTALVLLFLGILTLKSWEDGYIRDWLDDREAEEAQGREAHRMVVEEIGGDLQEIKSDVKETKQATQELAEQQDQIGEVVVMLHEDDPRVDGEALRSKMGVDGMTADIIDQEAEDGRERWRDSDRFYRGGDAGGPGVDD